MTQEHKDNLNSLLNRIAITQKYTQEDFNAVINLINEHTKQVIGEDEEDEVIQEFPVKIVKTSAVNRKLAEQRQRAGLTE